MVNFRTYASKQVMIPVGLQLLVYGIPAGVAKTQNPHSRDLLLARQTPAEPSHIPHIQGQLPRPSPTTVAYCMHVHIIRPKRCESIIT